MSFLGNAISAVTSPLTSLFGGQSAQSGIQSAVASQDAIQPYQGGFASLLNQLVQNPSAITSFPGYKFGMQQGEQAIQSSAAANGTLNSGGTLAALQEFGQGYGQQNWLSDINMLAGISQGNPAFAQLSAEGNLANTMGQVGAIGGAMPALQGLFGSGGAFGGIGSWLSNLFSGEALIAT